MSLAAETRRAVAEHPFLLAALRAGVVNFTAAARFLEVDGETDAVATALRRYADDLPAYETASREARVTMQSGIGPVESLEDALLAVGGTALGPGERTEFSYDVTARRGVHSFGPTHVVARNLSGEFEQERLYASDTTLTCVPPLATDDGPTPLREATTPFAGRERATTTGEG
ncbi:MAG: DUF7523 family protein, partial [Halorubrum sp.]